MRRFSRCSARMLESPGTPITLSVMPASYLDWWGSPVPRAGRVEPQDVVLVEHTNNSAEMRPIAVAKALDRAEVFGVSCLRLRSADPEESFKFVRVSDELKSRRRSNSCRWRYANDGRESGIVKRTALSKIGMET